VPHHCRQRLDRAAAQVIEIKLRDQRRSHIVFAMPAEARCVQDAALEFHEPHRTEAKFPQRARGMQQIEMRRDLGRGDGARHRETTFEQRPIERFSVEGNEHRPRGDTLR